MHDEFGAFCTHDRVSIAGAADGPLAGLTFAVKDVYDIAGRIACCGNPDWLATHEPAAVTAPSVQRLLDAGAALAGMTVTEELVMGMTGENPFYGAPVNVNAPGRVSGGSSSGSAAAVAAGLVDFALGSDTGGSVRVPASFCGIYGIRPSSGRISLDGVMPFAPSLDTVGWFARDPMLMRRVGAVMLDPMDGAERPGRLLVAADAFAVVDEAVRAALAPAIDRVAGLLGPAEAVAMADGVDLQEWNDLIAVYREYEGWCSHRDWIERCAPTLSENGARRMAMGAAIGADAVAAADTKRAAVRARMAALLADGAILAVPAAPGIAPQRGGGGAAHWTVVGRNGHINAVSPLCGLPQISLPLASVDGAPMGLGLMAAPGNDELLLDIAVGLGG
ncbi:MAG: amidase [Alphaproteobacteria bacterium]|jgi:amidase